MPEKERAIIGFGAWVGTGNGCAFVMHGDMDNKDYTVSLLYNDCPSRCPANSNYRMPIMSQRPPLKMEDVVQVRRGEHSARSCH